MTARALFLVAACLCGLCAVVQTLALVGTIEVKRFLMLAGKAALSSDAVGVLLLGVAFFFSLSCASRALSVAKRPTSPKERAEELAASYLVETYRPRPVNRTPCGEPIPSFPFAEQTKPRA